MILFLLISLSFASKVDKARYCVAKCAMDNLENELLHKHNHTKHFDNFEFIKHCFDTCKVELDNKLEKESLIDEGIEVEEEELKEGDLIFTKNNEAQIYIGNGKVAYVPQNKKEITLGSLDNVETARRIILDGQVKGGMTYTVTWSYLNIRADPTPQTTRTGKFNRGDKIQSLGLVRNHYCVWIKFKTFWGNIRYACGREFDSIEDTCYVSPCPSK